jgi:conjugal transfer/type IV secretion protein DotA/TraY
MPTTVGENAECTDDLWGMDCWFTKALGHADAKRNLVNAFATAHQSSINRILNVATDEIGAGASIARNLLFDVDTHFQGLQDIDMAEAEMAIQSQENQYIDQAVANTVALIDDLQRGIYSSYAQALNTHLNSRNSEGEDWLDAIDRVGWPVFGLYWFQMTNTSQRIMEAVSMNASYIGDASSFINTYHQLSGDEALSYRLANRYAEYEKRLSAALRNSRLDGNPLIGPQGQAAAEEAIREADNAKVLREIFPMMKNDIMELAGTGSTSPTDTGSALMSQINSMMRGNVFPWIVGSLREDNLVNSLVNAGHKIIVASEVIYLTKLWMESGEDVATFKANEENRYGWATRAVSNTSSFFRNAAQFLANPPAYLTQKAGTELMAMGSDVAEHQMRSTRIGNMLLQIGLDALSYWKYVFFVGLFLAFYLPAMIMIQWLIGLVTWIIYIVEATVVIPLWGLLFVGDMGEKAFAPSTARQGFVHMLSILVYPALMVIGFTIGLKVIDLSSIFFIDFLLIGFMNSTDGYLFGLLSLVFGLLIVGFACYQIIMRVFSIVLELNDRAIGWIGQRMNYGEGNIEGQVRGGFMAVLSKAEMHSRYHGQDNPSKPGKIPGMQQNPKQ